MTERMNMADKTRYPQIPSTVWWGVRSILQRTPNVTIDERFLGVQLNVQEAAARAYIAELTHVGILTEEGKATALAQKWRLDETYPEAVKELVSSAYPEGLLNVAGDLDRSKIVSWFQRAGLGQGAAGNKAATFLLVSSPKANEAPSRTSAQGVREGGARVAAAVRGAAAPAGNPALTRRERPAQSEDAHTRLRSPSADTFPLNVNVQIHISADAGSEQIESIFAAMRRYLYDAPNN
jgi:hypothetical protein